ncbi:MAG: electron transfer flavoprotein subunit beta [Elusimicrobia bacterium RIFOXYB2_FULL_50_12]|nr:MAG: electron transfer flavoprotein subunit beta [Elusimicrobia bacterium RIFOXYB2_FULL_50_12]
MHFIVCIKQVPNTTNVQIDSSTGTLKREGVESIINPFDEYAIEEAVRLKERTGGKATVITMGPPQAETALREAIARGIDNAILVTDRAFAGADTWATSYTLANAIKAIGSYDLILCGKQATDGDTAQVGPGIAEMLDIPHVAYVKKIEDINDKNARVERMMEDGYDLIEMPLPGLMTVVKEINTPRLPSLRGMMASKKAQIPHWTAQTVNAEKNNIGLTGSPTQVMKIFSPPPRPGGQTLAGSQEEMAETLVEKLRQAQII